MSRSNSFEAHAGANGFPMGTLQHQFPQPQGSSFNEFGNGDGLAPNVQYSIQQDQAGANEFPMGTLHHQFPQPQVNNGLARNDQYSIQQYQAGANGFPMGTQANCTPLQSVNTPIHQHQLAQHEVLQLQSGTATNFAVHPGPGLFNAQLHHRLDQPAGGAMNMVTHSMTHQMNPVPLTIPGSSQSSNISNADLEKKLKKQEADKKYRLRKEKNSKAIEEKAVKLDEEVKHLRKENGSLKEEGDTMKKELKNHEQNVGHLVKEVSRLNNKLKTQNTKVDVLSEKLVHSSEATDLISENKQLKRTIELLKSQLNNPVDSMKIAELQEQNEMLKREGKRLKVINEALCDKMSNNEREWSPPHA